MENVFIDQRLPKLGALQLTMIPLNVLKPDDGLFTAAFLQPEGALTATPDGIHNADSAVATAKHRKFLELAHSLDTDLVMTPEYSLPWNVLEEAVSSGLVPNDGSLWVLGCESITLNDLKEIENRCNGVQWLIAGSRPAQAKRFLDPVCYVFRAVAPDRVKHTIVGVQFKGQPMADHKYYIERDNMICGRERFIFRNDENSIHLSTLICSDALAFESDLPQHLHIPYLILHPQLNTAPRYNAFKKYRQDAYIQGREKQEFLCVNWAKGFCLPEFGPSVFGGSAYYTKSADLSREDERINDNHAKGLYYTVCPENRSHAYFFNYSEHVFYFRTTKASQEGALAVLRRRTGPQMEKVYSWRSEDGDWGEVPTNDGFESLCADLGGDLSPLSDAAMTYIDKERLLALSNGVIKGSKWFDVDELEFFQIKEDEVVRRMTFVQDPEPAAYEYRYRMLANFSRLRNQILGDQTLFPQCIGSFYGSSSIGYSADPNHNINLEKDDGSGKATVAYLGACSSERLQRAYDNVSTALEDDQRRRLVIWYEKDGVIETMWDERTGIDTVISEDPRSIFKEI